MLHSKIARAHHQRSPRERTIRVVVIVFLVAIVAVLFTALVFLYRDQGRGNRVVTMLAIRVLLSMTLIILLVVSWWMGWLQPTGG